MKKNKDDEVFDAWNGVKKELNKCSLRQLYFKEGQIWWCGLGRNIGNEAYGKSKKFSRPVLVFKKLDKYNFLGIPLTSQKHYGSWFVDFIFRNKHEFANLAQIRVLSTGRMYEKMGEVSKKDFQKIKNGFRRLYCENMPPC